MALPPPPSALATPDVPPDASPSPPVVGGLTPTGATDTPDPTGATDATGATVDPRELGGRLVGTIDTVLAGQHQVAELAVVTLFAGGHLLIEDIPGVGKTLLAQTIARAVGGTFARIQGTSDLLPGDVVGSMLPVTDGHAPRLDFRPGPVFANVVVFDELNRATPRTQSALLEAAEESTVTVDGTTHALPDPFLLVATQNPIEVAGTYGLGEGSLDRFATVVSPGRADAESELDVLVGRRGRSLLPAIEPVTRPAVVAAVRRAVERVAVADAVGGYVLALLDATRRHPSIRLGASTRAGVSLIALARARAALQGRRHVVPDDVVALAPSALGHRIIPADHAGSTRAGRELVAECVGRVAPPAG